MGGLRCWLSSSMRDKSAQIHCLSDEVGVAHVIVLVLELLVKLEVGVCRPGDAGKPACHGIQVHLIGEDDFPCLLVPLGHDLAQTVVAGDDNQRGVARRESALDLSDERELIAEVLEGLAHAVRPFVAWGVLDDHGLGRCCQAVPPLGHVLLEDDVVRAYPVSCTQLLCRRRLACARSAVQQEDVLVDLGQALELELVEHRNCSEESIHLPHGGD